MYHWIVDISNNNQNAQFHLTNDKPKCQLGLLHAETGEETPTEAMLYIDQNELMIERVGNTPIVLERGNRNRNLQTAHPTRILPQDNIRMGEAVFHIDRILHQDVQPRQKISRLRQMTNKAMLAGAAAMMMAVLPACNPSKPAQSPSDGGETNTVEVNQLEGKIAVPEDDNPSDANKPAKPSIDGLTQEQIREIEANNWEGEAPPRRLKDNENPAPSADSNADGSVCENGKRMCLTNNRYECENHRWKLIEKCQKPDLCKYDEASASTSCTKTQPCKDGEYACFGSSIRCEQEPGFNCDRDDEMYQCKDGHWQLATTCPEDQTCSLQDDGTAKCVAFPRRMGKPYIGDECKDGQMKCDSENAVMFCHWGQWKYKQVCSEKCVGKSDTDAQFCSEKCVRISDTDAQCEEVIRSPGAPLAIVHE